MRRTPITIAMLCAAMLVACLALPGGASASSRQLTVMQDDGLLYRSGSATRAATLDEFQALGADVVKVQIYWNEVAPGGSKKPSGFDATNPAGYSWAEYDEIVRGAVARGMQPYLVIGNRAPRWASRSGVRNALAVPEAARATMKSPMVGATAAARVVTEYAR